MTLTDWDEDVEVSAGAVRLAGQLAVPDQASGIVVFASLPTPTFAGCDDRR
ncbi:MAG: hypothetical protein ACLPKE_28300 [Streptosporangiaceae bacterium]